MFIPSTINKKNVIGMMYLGAANSSIDCRGTLAIHSYLQLHDLLRCNLKYFVL